MPELPGAMAARFERDDGLTPQDAALMAQSLAFAHYYETLRDACAHAKLAANWSASALAGAKVGADGLNSDLHGSADYRAALIPVLAGRAVG